MMTHLVLFSANGFSAVDYYYLGTTHGCQCLDLRNLLPKQYNTSDIVIIDFAKEMQLSLIKYVWPLPRIWVYLHA